VTKETLDNEANMKLVYDKAEELGITPTPIIRHEEPAKLTFLMMIVDEANETASDMHGLAIIPV